MTHDEAARFVGIDGGGTGSRAVVLGAGGEELGRAQGRAALVKPGSESESLSAIRDLVARALEAAGGEMPATSMVAGVAGVGREENRVRFESLLFSTGLAERVRVETDVDVAFYDAFATGPGILLVGGTGSVAQARTPGGRFIRVGGWGAMIGDEGSGWWIGIRALGAVLRAIDGRGPETVLATTLPARLGTKSPAELMDHLWTAPKGEVAGLAPLVAEAAEEGDEVAEEIVQAAVEALAAHVVPLLSEWRREEPEADPSVALVGGLVVQGGPLHDRLAPRIRALGGMPRRNRTDPALGAAQMALAR